MSKRTIGVIAGLALLLAATGCSSGPSCEDQGGKTVTKLSHYQPVLVGKSTILMPVYTTTCEMPDE